MQFQSKQATGFSSRFLADIINLSVLALLVCGLLPSGVLAQTISVTSPAGGVTHIESEDYFTTEVDNARDGSETDAIAAWSENLNEGAVVADSSSPALGDQAARFTLTGVGGYVMPIYPGHKSNLYPTKLPGDNDWAGNGINNPINASKYKVLSYRLKHSSRSNFAIYFENDLNAGEYLTTGNKVRSTNDGLFHFGGYKAHDNNEYVVYNYDLTNSSQFGSAAGTWEGSVFALRIDPSQGAAAGSTFDFDWIRLVPEADADRTLTITGSYNGAFSGAAITQIRLFVDSDAAGFDGSLLQSTSVSNSSGNVSFTVNTGIFPPGQYHFYFEIQNINGTTFGTTSVSGYSGALTVKARPRAYITSPAYNTGREYAQEAFNDPWDMNGSTDGLGDVANLANCAANGRPDFLCTRPLQHFDPATATFPDRAGARGGKTFAILADPPASGATESDVQVHLRLSNSLPLNPADFPYLVYRMEIDPTNYPDPNTQLRDGWVARMVAWNADIVNDGCRYKAHRVVRGMHTYVQDMRDPNVPEEVPGFAAPTPWASCSIRNLRLDPGEFTAVATALEIDYVALYSENYTTSGQYTVAFTLADADSSSMNVAIFRDDNQSGFDGTQIGTMTGLGNGNHTFVWDGSGVADNAQVYFYVVVTDEAGGTVSRYSQVHVNKRDFSLTPVARTGGVDYDYDGDGIRDYVVTREDIIDIPPRGLIPVRRWFINMSSTQTVLNVVHGEAPWFPSGIDIDGDARTDLYTVVPLPPTNEFLHAIIPSSDALNQRLVIFGSPGDQLVNGDFDGDGKGDIGVYRSGSWFIRTAAGGMITRSWGLAGDIPVPGFWDGDAVTDIAVFRPSTDGTILSTYYIINSTTGAATVKQWGLTGDIPVVGDLDDDNQVDYVVFREALGTWYITHSSSGSVAFKQFGLPGDKPSIGDYNGDGLDDLRVNRNFMNFVFQLTPQSFSNESVFEYQGSSTAQQFGLPSDTEPPMNKASDPLFSNVR